MCCNEAKMEIEPLKEMVHVQKAHGWTPIGMLMHLNKAERWWDDTNAWTCKNSWNGRPSISQTLRTMKNHRIVMLAPMSQLSMIQKYMWVYDMGRSIPPVNDQIVTIIGNMIWNHISLKWR